MKKFLLSALLLLLLLPTSACDDGGLGQPEPIDRPKLTILAAASLTDAFQELAVGFEKEHDATVTFSFGSSTDLAEQAVDGAPADVLATADQTSMATAVDGGVASEPQIFASNVLVIVTPPHNPAGIRGLDDLNHATWVRCADEAPCGRVALAVLADNTIAAEPVSLEDDVRATLDKVTSGEVDAGLVYATDAVAAGDSVKTIAVPGADSRSTDYAIAGLDQSQIAAIADDWIDYVMSDAGQRVLADAGFGRP